MAQDRSERSLKEINLSSLTRNRKYYPSPAAWEDQVLYFLLVDRFSDGKEYSGFGDSAGQIVAGPGNGRTTPLFDLSQDAWKADRATWFEAGKKWCGGTILGLKDKIGYLQPVGRHGHLAEPYFQASHRQPGLSRLRHSELPRCRSAVWHSGTTEGSGGRGASGGYPGHPGHYPQPRGRCVCLSRRASLLLLRRLPMAGERIPAEQWRSGQLALRPSERGRSSERLAERRHLAERVPGRRRRGHDGGKSKTENGTTTPSIIDGDFKALKDIDHGSGHQGSGPCLGSLSTRRRNSGRRPALWNLATAYKFWIAYADLDGYRIDTVKHMEPGAVRVFANVIHEFAQSLGKENFYLIGEITGGRAHAVHIVETTGIDAALGIDDIQDKLEFLAKGWRSPGRSEQRTIRRGYFDLFRNSVMDYKNSHQWYGKHIVTMFDDHDQVGTQHKFRFCGAAGRAIGTCCPRPGPEPDHHWDSLPLLRHRASASTARTSAAARMTS